MSDPIRINVNGTGTLNLENYCEANTVNDEIKLIPNRKIISKALLNYVPELNISVNFEVWRKLIDKDIENSKIPKSNLIIKNNLNKLVEVSKSLNSLQYAFIEKPTETISISNGYVYIFNIFKM